jgi:hypothetical protein
LGSRLAIPCGGSFSDDEIRPDPASEQFGQRGPLEDDGILHFAKKLESLREVCVDEIAYFRNQGTFGERVIAV